MNRKYSVIDSFVINGVQVLTLDKARNFIDFHTDYIQIDGRKYKYGLTHNERWITVTPIDNVKGKELTFMN